MDPIVVPNLTVKPIAGTKFFNVDASPLMLLANQIYLQIKVANPDVHKIITPEAIRYYATGLFWIRAIELRIRAKEALSLEESELRNRSSNYEFNIPEPLYYYYKKIGKSQTVGGIILQPTAPKLPTVKFGNIGGFFGRMDETLHINVNLYNEYPTLGVCGEAICHAVSDKEAGHYTSVLETQQSQPIVYPVKNVQGYFTLGYRRLEAKNTYGYLDITEEKFPESVESTGFNLDLMNIVSIFFNTTKVFKLYKVRMISL